MVFFGRPKKKQLAYAQFFLELYSVATISLIVAHT